MMKERTKKFEYAERREVAIIILECLEHDLANNANKLGDKDLKVLLMWKGVTDVSKMKCEWLKNWLSGKK
jgi:hypothetical protein